MSIIKASTEIFLLQELNMGDINASQAFAVSRKGTNAKSVWTLTVLPLPDVVMVYVYMRGYHCLPSNLQEKKPILNHNFYDLCSCFFYYCSFLPHPLLLSTPSGTLRSLTQLHWSPLFPHTALPAAPNPCQSFSLAQCTHMHMVYDHVL